MPIYRPPGSQGGPPCSQGGPPGCQAGPPCSQGGPPGSQGGPAACPWCQPAVALTREHLQTTCASYAYHCWTLGILPAEVFFSTQRILTGSQQLCEPCMQSLPTLADDIFLLLLLSIVHVRLASHLRVHVDMLEYVGLRHDFSVHFSAVRTRSSAQEEIRA